MAVEEVGESIAGAVVAVAAVASEGDVAQRCRAREIFRLRLVVGLVLSGPSFQLQLPEFWPPGEVGEAG